MKKVKEGDCLNLDQVSALVDGLKALYKANGPKFTSAPVILAEKCV